jgi:uncharacterized protein (TIGR03435 family)
MAISRFLITLALAGAGPISLAGQAGPAFEVASIRPAAELTPQSRAGLTITQRQARFVFLSLNDYIGIAYGVRLHQIAGPDWLASTRFDIAATMPEHAPADSLPAMMRTLLEERFKLRSHREQREFPVYGLEVLPDAKLEPVKEDAPLEEAFTVTSGPNASGGATVDLGQGSSLVLGNNRFAAKKVTMQTLADTLARFVDKPVVDMTKLAGRYDVAFDLSTQDFQAMMIRSAVAAGISLPPQAMQLLDQASPAAVPDALRAMGLSLAPRRAPLEVLVIDAIEKLPTDN